jgi:DNA primase
VEGRSAAVADALPILERLTDPVRHSEYGHLLADLAGVSESSVMQSLERRLGGRPQEVAKAMKRASAQDKVEREMLKLLTRDAQTFRVYAGMLQPEHFRNPLYRRTFEALHEAGGDVASLAGGEDTKLATTISSLAIEPLDGGADAEYARSVWTRLEEFRLKSTSDALRIRLQKLNPVTDTEFDELFHQLVGVDGALRRLRHDPSDVA